MSKKLSFVVLNCLAVLGLPTLANAAGTYYTGAGYQSAQYRYGQTGTYATSVGATRGTTNSMASIRNPGYTQQNANAWYQTGNTEPQRQTSSSQSQQKSSRSGFYLDAGLTHESAMWQFEMKNIANSVLHYDNLAWNVLDVSGGYIFDLGGTKVQADAGIKYGMQWGDATMVDDDITNGGYGAYTYDVATVVGHGLSIGTSQDSSLFGFNVGFGLTDFLQMGNIKITPSIGYRYMKTSLETKNNYGMLMDTVDGGCVSGDGESQCGVALLFYNTDSINAQPIAIVSANGRINISALPNYIDASDSYYYEQAGTSHSYDVEWSGPYIALDMLYDINANNAVNGRVELGFPGYTATGDQPYRWDWAHPKSVEDTASMFSAFHLGLSANWRTALTNTVALSLGATYDYYTVSGADSETYLNEGLYNQLVASGATDDNTLWYIDQLAAKHDSCGGWVCKSSKEIDSIYKSMGVRIGIEARF